MKNLSRLLPLIILMFVAFGCSNFSDYVANKACTIDGFPEPKTSDDFGQRASKHWEKDGYSHTFNQCAFSDLGQAIKLDDKNYIAYAQRGLFYSYNNQNDEALKDFAKAIELAPEYSPVYSSRAEVYKTMGNLDAAIADMNKSIELNPARSDYDTRAELYELKGNYENAAEDYTAAIELQKDGTTMRDGKEFLYYQLRAAAYRKLGKEDLAKADDEAIKTFNKEKYGHVGNADPNLAPNKTETQIGGSLKDQALTIPEPEYPAVARAVKASGKVVVEVQVGKGGDVVAAQATSGHAMLKAAAVKAAMKATFKPGPELVKGTLEYDFKAP